MPEGRHQLSDRRRRHRLGDYYDASGTVAADAVADAAGIVSGSTAASGDSHDPGQGSSSSRLEYLSAAGRRQGHNVAGLTLNQDILARHQVFQGRRYNLREIVVL